ncbi:MAG: branched-chain amino acid ABC transporter ATP-binding protein/permease, partial [Chloroflexota bacterium]
AFTIKFVYAETVHWTAAGNVLFMTVVGGQGSFFGPILGTAIFIGLRDWLSSFTENWMVFFGTVFILFVLFAPDGIMGLVKRYNDRRKLAINAAQFAAAPATAEATRTYTAPVRRVAPGPDAPIVLQAHGVTKRFGAMAAVDSVDMVVRQGYIHAIIGPNGAGKTTLFNCLTGILNIDGGRVELKGRDVTKLAPYRRIDMGLGRSFQIINVFQKLTVLENMRVAAQAASKHRFDVLSHADALSDVVDKAHEVLGIVGLVGKDEVIAANLSHGDQRLLEIGLSLAANPEVLLLDEPFAGLTDSERTFTADLIRRLAQDHTVLIIEHDIDRVLEISDRITVMHMGKVLAEGSPDEIQQNPAVQSAYLGGFHAVARADAGVTGITTADRPVLLKLDGINTYYGKSHILHDVSLEVRQGEVVALLGRNGVGKTTTLRSIMGVTAPRGGKITYRDVVTSALRPHLIAQQGIGIVPEGRRIFPNLTVTENLLVAQRKGRGDKVWTIEDLFQLFPGLAARRNSKGDNLSGGERQMLAMARTLMGNVDLLLLDEPFEGLSPAVIADIWHAIDGMRGHVSILLVEHNVSLTLALCDRVYVMSNGRVTHTGDCAELAGDEAKQIELLGV